MKARSRTITAMTLLEVSVSLVAIGMLIVVFVLPALAKARSHCGPTCVNYLKQIGISYRVWEDDNGDRYPMAALTNDLGMALYSNASDMFEYYRAMSNEISNPKILICPMDKTRVVATNFTDFNNNSKTSYFIGFNSTEDQPLSLLGGDFNLTNGTALKNGVLELTTNHVTGWIKELHNKSGNLLFGEGSVQTISSAALNQAIARSGLATNKLLMPVY